MESKFTPKEIERSRCFEGMLHAMMAQYAPKYLEYFQKTPFALMNIGFQDGADFNALHKEFPKASLYGITLGGYGKIRRTYEFPVDTVIGDARQDSSYKIPKYPFILARRLDASRGSFDNVQAVYTTALGHSTVTTPNAPGIIVVTTTNIRGENEENDVERNRQALHNAISQITPAPPLNQFIYIPEKYRNVGESDLYRESFMMLVGNGFPI